MHLAFFRLEISSQSKNFATSVHTQLPDQNVPLPDKYSLSRSVSQQRPHCAATAAWLPSLTFSFSHGRAQARRGEEGRHLPPGVLGSPPRVLGPPPRVLGPPPRVLGPPPGQPLTPRPGPVLRAPPGIPGGGGGLRGKGKEEREKPTLKVWRFEPVKT